MKVNPALKQELANWLNTYWTTYLKGDIETWATFIRDDYRNIGGTKEEIWNSKQEIIDYTNSIMDQMLGSVEIRNREIEVIPYSEYMMVNEFTDIYVKIEGEWTLYGPFRMSSLLEKTDNGWIALHQHGSYPDMKALEGEAFSMNAVKAENVRLLEAVKNRTTELENKNRELEIETTLEKVRSSALAMNEPADMVQVCKVISDQLQLLGVTDIRNVQTAIINEQKGTYLNYQYFAAYKEGVIEDTDYNLHLTSYAIAQEMKKSAHTTFSGSMEGLELNTFREWRKQYNQFPDPLLDEVDSIHYYFYSIGKGGLGLSTYKSLSEEGLAIFKRFHNVFTLAYRRFIDIELALAQAREAQIEAAVERVRAQSMAMYQTTDLHKVNEEVLNQLYKLKVDGLTGVSIYLVDEYDTVTIWDLSSPGNMSIPNSYSIKYDAKKYPVMGEWVEIWKTTHEDYFVLDFPKEKLIKAVEEFKEILPEMGIKFNNAIESGSLIHQWNPVGRLSDGVLSIDLMNPPSEDTKTIVIKMTGAFNMAYQRFLDLQKAEAQAREAQLEASLERVRAHAMGLRKSDELQNIITVIFEELQKLGLTLYECSIFLRKGNSREFTVWGKGNMDDGGFLTNYRFYFVDHPILNRVLRDLELKIPYREFSLGQDEIKSYGDLIFSQTDFKDSSQEYKDSFYSLKRVYAGQALFQHGILEAVGTEPLPGDLPEVLKRFSHVVDLTYTRFLDLQKAEAQAREAQIEVALERVRSRTMAMQSSAELGAVAAELFAQMNQLVTNLWTCGFVLCEKDRDEDEWWLSMDGDFTRGFFLPNVGDFAHATLYEGWFKGEAMRAVQLDGELLQQHYNWLMEIPVSRAIFEEMDAAGLARPDWQKLHAAYFSKGYLVLITREPCGEEEIFRRFAQVFDQTYTRFLDLRKAEAQAKEARIEATLEKIRSRALAMRNSAEVGDVSTLLFTELEKMDINPSGFSIMIFNNEQDKYELWRSKEVANQGVYETFSIKAMFDKLDQYVPGFGEELKSSWANGKPFFIGEFRGKKRVSFLQANREMANYSDEAFEKMKRMFPDPTFWHLVFFKYGWFGVLQNEQLPEEDLLVIHRFAEVFDFAYTRFLDLQKAEAQAREAKIELSLERIRAQVTSMQESSELLDIVVNMRNEFVSLGHEAHYFWHMRWLPEKYEKAMTSGDGTRIGMVMTLPRHIHGDIKLVADWEKTKEPSLVLAMDAETAVDYVHKMITLGDFEIVDHNAPTLDDIRHIGGLTFVMARTTHGEIGFSLPGSVPNPPTAAVDALARFAGVFDLAYKRFEDLKTAEKDLIEIKAARQNAEEALLELKATQAQLIQSEKMASLGELTAGIAHEIQNPLNFVNNFSEVNMELIAELKEELEAGNLEDIKAIANDIAINEEKILQHGKRADSIVKGMLQHSRISNGQKELTDINSLCDEYLRLSYHGLRAKDKSFNADFKTEFDASLPKINIIPQDIGRVLLNLINNAFYAVAEKQRNLTALDNYVPTVIISTKNLSENIEISVKDNGNGIPEEIKKKIFQPFFTTKPTGEGTGLGLSLAYDIVKAHGGELKVDTKKDEGTAFIVQLPI